MTIRIAWGITGAGCWLPESYEILGRIVQNKNVQIDLFYSNAGREVSQCYGVFKPPVPVKTPFLDKVREIPNFNQDVFLPGFVEKYQWLGSKESESIDVYLKRLDEKNSEQKEEFDFDEAFNDVIFEIDEGGSTPSGSSAATGKYDFVIISPATGNTVAKLAHGIADSLLTNLAIMANKSGSTEVLVVPTDYRPGKIKSYLPVLLHQEVCQRCQECSALWACKPGAIRRKRGKVRINRLKCIGCLDCVKYCRHTIITFLEETEVTVRKREAEAVKQLANIEGFSLFETPEKLYTYLSKHLK